MDVSPKRWVDVLEEYQGCIGMMDPRGSAGEGRKSLKGETRTRPGRTLRSKG